MLAAAIAKLATPIACQAIGHAASPSSPSSSGTATPHSISPVPPPAKKIAIVVVARCGWPGNTLPDSAPPQTNTIAPPTPDSARASDSAPTSRTSPVASSAAAVTTMPIAKSARLPVRRTSIRASSAPPRYPIAFAVLSQPALDQSSARSVRIAGSTSAYAKRANEFDTVGPNDSRKAIRKPRAMRAS